MILFLLLITLNQELIVTGQPCVSCAPFTDILNPDGVTITSQNGIDSNPWCSALYLWLNATGTYKILVMVDTTGKDDYQPLEPKCDGWIGLACDKDNAFWNLFKVGNTTLTNRYRVYKIKLQPLRGERFNCDLAYCETCPPLTLNDGLGSTHQITDGHDGTCAKLSITWKADNSSKILLTLDKPSSDDQTEKAWMALKCKNRLDFTCNDRSEWVLKIENGTELSVSAIESEVLMDTEQKCNYDLCKLCQPFEPAGNATEVMYVDGIDEAPGCLKRELSWPNPNRSKIQVIIVDQQNKTYRQPLKCNETLSVTCNEQRQWEMRPEETIRKVVPASIVGRSWPGTEGKCDELPCGTCAPFDRIINDDWRINYSIQYKKGHPCLLGFIKWSNKDRSKIRLNIITKRNGHSLEFLYCEQELQIICTYKREWGVAPNEQVIRSIRPKILRDTQGKCDLEACATCRSLANHLAGDVMPDIKMGKTESECSIANLTWKSKDNAKILLIIQTREERVSFYYENEQVISLFCSAESEWFWRKDNFNSGLLVFIEALVLPGSQGRANSKICDTCPRDFNFIMGDGKANIEERVDKDGCGVADIRWYTTKNYKLELHVYLDDNSIKQINLKSQTSIRLVCSQDRKWKWKKSEGDAPIPITSLITRIVKGSENRTDEDVCNTCTESDLKIHGLADWNLQHSVDLDGCGIGVLSWRTKDKSKISLNINLPENETRTILLNCSSVITIHCSEDRKWMWNDTVSEEPVAFVSMRSEILKSTADKCDQQVCGTCLKFDRPINGDGTPNITEGLGSDGCAMTNITWHTDDNYKLMLTIKIDGHDPESVELFCNTTLTLNCNEAREWIWTANEPAQKSYKMRLTYTTDPVMIDSLETKVVANSQGRCADRLCSLCDENVAEPDVSGDISGVIPMEVDGCMTKEVEYKNDDSKAMEAIWKDDQMQGHRLPLLCTSVAATVEWPRIAWQCAGEREWIWTKDSIPGLPSEKTAITIKVLPSQAGACNLTACQICDPKWSMLNQDGMQTDSIELAYSTSMDANNCLNATLWLAKAGTSQMATGNLSAIGLSSSGSVDYLYCDASTSPTIKLENLTLACSNDAAWLFTDLTGTEFILGTLSYSQLDASECQGFFE